MRTRVGKIKMCTLNILFFVLQAPLRKCRISLCRCVCSWREKREEEKQHIIFFTLEKHALFQLYMVNNMQFWETTLFFSLVAAVVTVRRLIFSYIFHRTASSTVCVVLWKKRGRSRKKSTCAMCLLQLHTWRENSPILDYFFLRKEELEGEIVLRTGPPEKYSQEDASVKLVLFSLILILNDASCSLTERGSGEVENCTKRVSPSQIYGHTEWLQGFIHGFSEERKKRDG